MSAMAQQDASHAEPGFFLAGVLAILVHVFFVVFMVFGLNWKTQPPEGVIVDLWSDLPQQVKPSPPLPQKTESSKPKPAPQPVQAEPLPPKIKALPPPPTKPDIARKVETKKLKPVKEEKPVPEVKKEKEKEKEREREREREKEKEKEREKEKRKVEAERLQREQALQQKREQEAITQQREAQQAAAQARLANEVDKYKAMILAKIKSRIITPPDLPGDPKVEYRVTLLPGGDILDVSLRRSSGFAVFDNAVERAIFLSKPLPLPPEPALFSQFRNLSITVHYRE